MTPEAESFLEEYAESLDKPKSLKASGLAARLLRKMTEPRFAEYDNTFTEAFLGIEETLKAEMVGVAKEVAESDSRQKLGAAKWLAGEVDREVKRVEDAHIRWLEDQARERALGAPRAEKRLPGDSGVKSIEDMKSGGGSFSLVKS